MRSAVSKSTWVPSTAAARMLRGAGIGAPLSVLRRLAGNAGSTAASAGVDGVPPGILYFGWSQGWEASGWAAIHARALSSISSGVAASSSTIPTSRAFAGLCRWPCESTLRKPFMIPSMRVMRVTPPPPGSRPSVTSGSP
jgi:hypothetical protein